MARLSQTVMTRFQAAFRSNTVGKMIFEYMQRLLPVEERVGVVEDFLGVVGASLPPWLTTKDTSSAGTPTFAFVASGDGGQWAMKPDTTNEAEIVGLYQGDQLTWELAKGPVLRFRFKIEPDVTGAGGAFAAGDKLVIGLASARADTLDDVVSHAWIRMEGANANILFEADNGTADVDDKDTTIDWAANTWITVRIDARNPADVKLYINEVARTPAGFTFAMPTSGNVQFLAELQKAAATNEDHRITFDYVEIDAAR